MGREGGAPGVVPCRGKKGSGTELGVCLVPVMDVCLLLQDLYKSCARGGGVKRGDVCYGMIRAAACVDESDHHALMYVRHGQTVRVSERLVFIGTCLVTTV